MLPVQTNSTLIFFMRHPDGSTIIRSVMAQADRTKHRHSDRCGDLQGIRFGYLPRSRRDLGQVDLADVATPEAFARDPDRVHAFYNHRRAGLLDCERAAQRGPPCARPARKRLARHRASGHPEHRRPARARRIGRAGPYAWRDPQGALPGLRRGQRRGANRCRLESRCPACGRSATLRVDVVWFGEVPYHLEPIFATLARLRPLRLDRHLRQCLSRCRLRPGSARERPRPYRRAQPRAVRGPQPVRRTPLRPGQRSWSRLSSMRS